MKAKPNQINGSGAKWLPGAMAVAAAGGTTQAATVQITFSNSYVSSTSTLVTDFGGDGNAEIASATGFTYFVGNREFAAVRKVGFGGGIIAAASMNPSPYAPQPGPGAVRAGIGDNWPTFPGGGGYLMDFYVLGFVPWASGVFSTAFGSSAVTGGYALTISDANVRGGAPTSGWLDMTARTRSGPSPTRVIVSRFVFDDETGVLPAYSSLSSTHSEFAVPESSSVALLALGAAGLLMRRNRKDSAQGPNV